MRKQRLLIPVILVAAAWGLLFSSLIGSDAGAAGSASGLGIPGGWQYRVMTQQELERIAQREPDLSPSVTKRLLAKINARDFDYIAEDIRQGRAIRVPNDIGALRSWSPMPKYIREVSGLPRFILISKDIPYIGWYEHGKLVGDTYICIGRDGHRTDAGIYRVKEKDRDHVSRSYPNAYGEPAPMPWAMRIYELVWIHAGDIARGQCSHGCVNLPVLPAVELFDWATVDTPVVIVEGLGEVPATLARNRSNCTLFASACAMPGAASRRAG